MATANIRKLQVLPSRSADLCFGASGVIALQNFDHHAKTGAAYIGQAVAAYDIAAGLYAHLAETVTDAGDPRYPGDPSARLKYDSGEIHKALTAPGHSPPPFLFVLRNETLAAVLDQAIARREGAYFQRFKHAAAIQRAMTDAYPAILNYLSELERDAALRFEAIDRAHAGSGHPAVIQETETRSYAAPNAKATTTTKQRNTITVNGEFDAPDQTVLDTRVIDELEADAAKKHVQSHLSDRAAGFPYAYSDASGATHKFEKLTGEYVTAQVAETVNTGDQIAKTVNPAFFHPRLDNSVAHKQLLSALASEKMNQGLASLSAPHTERIIADERAATDFEVRRLQVAFADTYLVSPLSGVVTAVFKDVGECVQPGEPVLRVENDAVVFLAGRVQFYGVLRIGQDVVVRASDLFESKQSEDFPGKIRGIRGHEADDDEWEILVECDNPVDGAGRRKLPIYYQFDRDTTKLIVP